MKNKFTMFSATVLAATALAQQPKPVANAMFIPLPVVQTELVENQNLLQQSQPLQPITLSNCNWSALSIELLGGLSQLNVRGVELKLVNVLRDSSRLLLELQTSINRIQDVPEYRATLIKRLRDLSIRLKDSALNLPKSLANGFDSLATAIETGAISTQRLIPIVQSLLQSLNTAIFNSNTRLRDLFEKHCTTQNK